MTGPADSQEASRTFERRDVWALFALLAIAAVLPAVIGALSGSLDIARNDDFSYRKAAIQLYDTGRFELDGWASMTLIGQLLIAQPFLWLSGGGSWGLAATGILFAVIAIVAGYLVVRRLLGTGRAVFAILLLPLFPGYLAYATSFMTDVPAMAAEFLCLLLGFIALERRPIRVGWLAASLGVGLLGFSIREFGLAAPVAVLTLAILADPRRLRPWLLGASFLVACVAVYEWRSLLPGQIDTGLGSISYRNLDRVLRSVSTGSLVLLPVIVVSWAGWWRHLRVLDVGAGVVIAMAVVGGRLIDAAASGSMPVVLLDDLITQWGTPGPSVLIGGRPVVFPDAIWAAINGLALIATIVVLGTCGGMIGAFIRRGPAAWAAFATGARPAAVVALFVAGTGLGLVIYSLVASMIDRYLWPLIPPMAALILSARPDLTQASVGPATTLYTPSRERGTTSRLVILMSAATSGGLLVVLAVMATALFLNSAAFDGARWRAGESLAAAGVPGESVDAGFEWVGFHAPGLATVATPVRALTWWEAYWPEFRLCGFVASQPQDYRGTRLVKIDTVAYRIFLFAGFEEPLYTYRIDGRGCS